MAHSRFVAANSFSRFTNSVSFASLESISLVPFARCYQLPEAPPPPLLPPPNPPNPPPPPPKPPPPQFPPPPDRPPELFASTPRRNQSQLLPPDPLPG